MKITEDILIKKLTEDNWRDFKKIRLEAVTYHSHFYLTNFEIESLKDDDYWKNTLSDSYNGAVFGIYVGNTVIGLMGAFRHRDSKTDTAILGMVYIRDGYRGMNLSDRLYKESIDWAKKQDGIKRILVSHRDDNEASKSTIKKWGFNLYDKMEITYGDKTTGLSHRYELQLDGKKS